MNATLSRKRLFTVVFAALVALSLTFPESSARNTQTVMGDYPCIILPYPPESRVMLVGYWSVSPNMTYSFSFLVTDTDGVACVIVMYVLLSEGVWHNLSAEATKGDTNVALYAASFVGPKDSVEWKVLANDSQGRWTESGTIEYLSYMIAIDPRVILATIIPVIVALVAASQSEKKQLLERSESSCQG